MVPTNKVLLKTRDISSSMTALHIALMHGYDDIVEVLLAAGVDTMATITQGYNILHLALRLTNELSRVALTDEDQPKAAQAASRTVMETIKLTEE